MPVHTRAPHALVRSALAFAILSATVHAAPAPDFDALDGRRADAAVAARGHSALAVRGHHDERLGLPSFLWVGAQSPAHARLQAGATPERAARAQFAALAELYGLAPGQVDALELHEVQALAGGAHLVRLRQRVQGIEVFRDGVSLLTDRHGRLTAIAGHVGPALPPLARRVGSPADLGFLHDARDAIARVLADHGLQGESLAVSMQQARSEGDYTWYDAATPARTGEALQLQAPLRTRPVWFRLPEGLVPAWYVESQVQSADGERYLAHVISAKDGTLLFRRNLVSHDAYSYRVWSKGAPEYRPLSGPQGNSFFPHPTGVPDGSQPPFVPASLVTLQNVPFSRNDPWLAPNETVTRGNNVDAYADLVAPDGFNGGDRRATATAPGTFDRSFDVSLSPNANSEQIDAATTQLFYTTNWLHDAYYDAGFDEAAGNAQADNFGRGGLDGDAMRAEAQDYVARNNANMATPADGVSPRMQMFVFDTRAPASFSVQPGNQSFTTQAAGFGPSSYTVTADLIEYIDGAPAANACAPPGNAIAGRIALIRRGGCSFAIKVANAQAAGAVGAVIDNNVAQGLPAMGGDGTPVAIPSVGISQADGAALRAQLGVGALVATLERSGLDRDGTLDNGIVAHEWGHYISNRLVGNAAGLSNLQGNGMGEGWGDFHALLLLVDEGSDPGGVYSASGYAVGAPAPNNSYYYGLRRYPYSTDPNINPLSFRHIQDSAALPAVPPPNFISANSGVHNTGEVWASMLWQCYAGLLADTPRLSYQDAYARMRQYLVAGYKLTPNAPTLIEARDALLAAISVSDPDDFAICSAAFAERGAGFGAVAPPRDAPGNEGVTESFAASGGALALIEADLDDQPGFCDLDGVLDGGETGTLTIELANTGFDALPDSSTLSVSSSSPGVSFPNGTTVAVPGSVPFGEAEAAVPVAYAPIAGVQEISFDLSWSGPDLAAPGSATVAFRVNSDEIEDASASDDAESEEPVWENTLSNGADANFAWQRVTASTSQHRFHGPDSAGIGVTAWVSPPLQVSATQPLQLSFRHRHDFEFDGTYWDGGVVEISSDNGASWIDVATLDDPGYSGTLTDTSENPFGNRQAYGGRNASWPDLETVQLDLGNGFAGQTVRIRFAIGTDMAVGGFGWELDDIGFSGIDNTPFPSVVAHASLCSVTDVQAGANQSTLVGTVFASPLTVRVTDADGDELDEVPVRFTILSEGGATARFPGDAPVFDTLTDEDGMATAPAPTANAVGGSYDVEVQVGAQRVRLTLSNTPATSQIFRDGFED